LKIWHVLLLSLLFTVYSVFKMQNLGPSGDEPHYLLITKSLVYDGDLNVKNQYLQGQWKEFYQRKKVRILPHARPVSARTWLSIHLPGTSVLMIPFYALSRPLAPPGKKIVLRLGFSLYGLIFLYILYLFLREEFSEEVSLYATALIAFTAPAFPYFFHIFPEIPVALIITLSLLSLWRKNRGLLILSGLMAGALPWFGAKYAVYLLVLLLLSLYFLRKKSPYFLLPALLPLSAFLYFLKVNYGNFSLLSVYYGPLPPGRRLEVMKDILYRIPWHYRFSTFLDYLFDQRDGLLPYAPVALLSLAALLRFWRRKIALTSLLLVLPFVFNYGWQTHRGGYCPPARPLTSAVWALAVGYALFLHRTRNGNLKFTFKFLVGVSSGLAFLLASLPMAYYGPTTHDVANRVGLLFHKLSTPAVYLPSVLPSFTKHPRAMPSSWLPNYFWVPLVLALLLLAVLKMEKTGRERKVYLTAFFIVLLLPFLVLPQIPLAKKTTLKGGKYAVKVYNWEGKRGRCFLGGNYDPIVFITRRPITVKGWGKVLVNGRRKRKVGEETLVSPAVGMPFLGGRLLALRVLEGKLEFCP